MRLDDEKMLIADIASRLLVTMSNWSDQERATQTAVSRAIGLLAEIEAQVEAEREINEACRACDLAAQGKTVGCLRHPERSKP